MLYEVITVAAAGDDSLFPGAGRGSGIGTGHRTRFSVDRIATVDRRVQEPRRSTEVLTVAWGCPVTCILLILVHHVSY